MMKVFIAILAIVAVASACKDLAQQDVNLDEIFTADTNWYINYDLKKDHACMTYKYEPDPADPKNKGTTTIQNDSKKHVYALTKSGTSFTIVGDEFPGEKKIVHSYKAQKKTADKPGVLISFGCTEDGVTEYLRCYSTDRDGEGKKSCGESLDAIKGTLKIKDGGEIYDVSKDCLDR